MAKKKAKLPEIEWLDEPRSTGPVTVYSRNSDGQVVALEFTIGGSVEIDGAEYIFGEKVMVQVDESRIRKDGTIEED